MEGVFGKPGFAEVGMKNRNRKQVGLARRRIGCDYKVCLGSLGMGLGGSLENP